MLSEYHAMDSLYYSAATCGRENLFEADGGGGTTATLQVCSVFSLDDSTLSESSGSGNGLFGAPQPCGNNPNFAAQVGAMAEAINALHGGKGFAVDSGRPAAPLHFRFNYSVHTYPFGSWETVGKSMSRSIFPSCDFVIGMPNGCLDSEIMAQALIANETRRLYFTGRGPRAVLTAMGEDQPYFFSSHVRSDTCIGQRWSNRRPRRSVADRRRRIPGRCKPPPPSDEL